MIFKIISKNDKFFDNVSRVSATNTLKDISLEIDLHNLFFKFYQESMSSMISFEFHLSDKLTNTQEADYMMNGLVFKKTSNELLISFGGLLGSLTNFPNDFKENQEVVCLINPIC